MASALGNRQTERLLRASLVQAKLKISQPADPYEREADHVAEAVLRMPEASLEAETPAAEAGAPDIGRKCAACEQEEEETLQREAATGSTSSGTETLPASIETRVEAGRTGGKPLPETVRAFFEPRFGRDFSHVRVHTDGKAGSLASSLQARAYTIGSDIVFAKGQFAPGTEGGKKLLAHELAHVVQQGRAQVLRRCPAPLPISQLPDATVSRQADVAEAVSEIEEGKKPKEISSTEASEIGEEALRNLGYERIMALAEQAGFVKPSAESAGETEVQRMPDSTTVWRDATTAGAIFAREFTRYAVAAGIASQVDSPAPGPGDAVAVGILIVGLAAAGYLALSSSPSSAPTVPAPAPAPPVAIPVPQAPPVPLAPPVPRDTTQDRTETETIPRVIPKTETPKTCATQHPDEKLCANLPWGYSYSSPQQALAALKARTGKKDLRLEKPTPTTHGPCPGKGRHYGVRSGGEYVASIVCCPCCLDSPAGPRVITLCKIV